MQCTVMWIAGKIFHSLNQSTPSSFIAFIRQAAKWDLSREYLIVLKMKHLHHVMYLTEIVFTMLSFE